MLINEIMSKPVECVDSKENIVTVAAKMKSVGSGFLPVCENDKLVGVVTDRDIVVRGVAGGKDINSITIKEVMTEEVIYCYENNQLLDVLDKMEENHIRRIIVLNESKRLVGVISIDDIAAKAEGKLITGETLARINEKIKRILLSRHERANKA